MRRIFYLPAIVIFLTGLTCLAVRAQQDTVRQEWISVIARPYADSVLLRWAPLNVRIWQQGNAQGYRIERYTLMRDGEALSPPEKIILQEEAKPIPAEKWESLVKSDRYAAIAAQALFGDRFEVDLSKSNLFSIVDKVRENDQRFSFALFSADMSPRVAQASGLWHSDKHTKKGEKYLYRVIINRSQPEARGSLFIGADQKYSLPAPQNLKAEIKGNQVSLRWEKAGIDAYTAYSVTRSVDGKNFTPLSETPMITLTPESTQSNRYEYASDSLESKIAEASYRVHGITPFGESGAYSNTVKAVANILLTEIPVIRSCLSEDNKTIQIQWEFSKEQEKAINGFSVESSPQPKGTFTTLRPWLPPETRTCQDKTPHQTNYYRITAFGKDNSKVLSPVYLAQLIDSLPPIAPVGLKAMVDDAGYITLSWEQNQEADLYGYRVYKANNEKEEATQLTHKPTLSNQYADTVNLKALNDAVYYQVMAIDKNQNHSQLSALLKAALPDKVKPQAPAVLPITSSDKGVALSWIRSGSADAAQYAIYRRATNDGEWKRIKIIPARASDTVYAWTDDASQGIGHYSITAIDDAGLESDPTAPVRGGKIDARLKEAIKWKRPALMPEQQQVKLNWQYEPSDVKAFRLYRAVDAGSLLLHKTISGDQRNYSETARTGKKYTFRIMAVFEGGRMSELSKELTITF